jgi:hypothetical protein
MIDDRVMGEAANSSKPVTVPSDPDAIAWWIRSPVSRGMVTKRQAEYFVSRFEAGWSAPHPNAWDDLFTADARFEQPLLMSGRGLPLLQREFAHLFGFLPDMTGRVARWGLADDAVLIELECRASVAGHSLDFVVVDRCLLDDVGLCTHRTTYMDPMPLALAVAMRPRSWLGWWRSGVGPVLIRRRLLGRNRRVARH